jgi:DNA-binding transcriptional MocR family regulator
MVDQLISSKFLQTHINTVLRPTYASRYHRMISAIKEYLLPLNVTLPYTSPLETVTGGYFIWIALPPPLRASTLAQFALKNHGVKVAEGDLFKVQRDPAVGRNEFGSSVRLCFAWEEEGKLAEGVRRFGCAVREMIGNEDEEGGLR